MKTGNKFKIKQTANIHVESIYIRSEASAILILMLTKNHENEARKFLNIFLNFSNIQQFGPVLKATKQSVVDTQWH